MAATAHRYPDQYRSASQGPASTDGMSRSASQRQRNGQNRGRIDYQHAPTVPSVPDVPRGPPNAYRQSAQPESPLTPTGSRSFSERLRDNPRENLSRKAEWDPYTEEEISPGVIRNGSSYPGGQLAEYGDYTPTNTARSSDPSRRRSAGQSIHDAHSTRKQAEFRDLPPLNTQSAAKSTDMNARSAQHSSPMSRSGSVRRPANLAEDQGDWASHRSPLQKLELTLNGISKEEKRARVEEAEMLMRESHGKNGNRSGGNEAQSAATLFPERSGSQRGVTAGSGGRPRAASSSQIPRPSQGPESSARRRIQESQAGSNVNAPIHDARRDENRKSAHVESVSVPRHPAHEARLQAAEARPPRDGPPASTNADPSRTAYGPQGDLRRGFSARQARAEQLEQSIPSNITRAVSSQRSQPPATFSDNGEYKRTGPRKEVNTSYKAALAEGASAGAIAAAATAANGIGRSNSRKLQKLPPKQRETTAEDRNAPEAEEGIPQNGQTTERTGQYYARGAPKQVDIQRSSSKRSPTAATVGSAPVGLGLDHTSVEDPERHKHHHLSDVFHHKPRQQSVSFKEPFDRARPVEEWKYAKVARITLQDMDLDGEAVEKDKAWWEGGGSARRKSRRSSATTTNFDGAAEDRHPSFKPRLYLKCGPLLRYTGMKRENFESRGRVVERETWRGTVMIVTDDTQSSYEEVPTLRLFSQPMDLLPPPPSQVDDNDGELAPEYVDPLAGLTTLSRTGKRRYVRPIDHVEPGKDLSRVEDDNGLYEDSASPIDLPDGKSIRSPNDRICGVDGEKVGKYKEVKGHRIYADLVRGVTFWRFYLEVELGEHQAHIAYRINHGAPVGFWVPARGQTMNIMFHSCNGFSLSVKPDEFSGPDPLWRDVLNTHQSRPFHVMIGGGDQIYNDKVMVETTHFAEWLKLKNPHDKHHAVFTSEMEEELEAFYLERYCMWFSQGLFAMANSQIPMINIWDDHDIIDGFGSYPDHFMRTPVFSGLGNIAFKYYMLFQQQSVPEETQEHEPSWLLGPQPGPYITQRSRSIFLSLGRSVTFLGIDCRTERKRDEIIADDTVDVILERCRREIIEGETKHLIVLLGVPIAYPRLVWLENVLTSRAMDPIKALGRAGILKGGFLNKFDGGVEILDDLDDHWTASGHKTERQYLLEDLQDLAAEKSVRITILGGDVHLAAVGQFYTNPKYKIPKDRDHRYILNVISSAICNTPPGEMLADILNKRNKVHHFDHYTDEDMVPMFTHDVDGRKRNNKTLLPRRNWCSIREYIPGMTPPATPSPPTTPSESDRSYSPEPPKRSFSFSRADGKSGNLLRRLSLRGRAPPSSYRDDMNVDDGERRRSASVSGVARPTERGDGYFPADSNPARSQHQPHDPQSRTSSVIPRPGNFQRRPTNLSEKAAKRGGGRPLEDEEDFHDHINLQGGLDIILNCEVSRADPAGITTPYRLLVPALFYNGSADDMHHDGVEGVKRKGSLLKRFTFGGGRRKSSLARNQGRGNWGQGSETGSESGAEHVEEEQQATPTGSGGYNGVEAYRDKPKRRWF